MAIQQTKKQSDLEKRLQLLRRQVYGKGPENRYNTKSVDQQGKESHTPTYRHTETPTHRIADTLALSDITHFRQDLLKILILSSFAIGVQVILFFLLKNHLLNLNFF